jgi:hypothetical protein
MPEVGFQEPIHRSQEMVSDAATCIIYVFLSVQVVCASESTHDAVIRVSRDSQHVWKAHCNPVINAFAMWSPGGPLASEMKCRGDSSTWGKSMTYV